MADGFIDLLAATGVTTASGTAVRQGDSADDFESTFAPPRKVRKVKLAGRFSYSFAWSAALKGLHTEWIGVLGHIEAPPAPEPVEVQRSGSVATMTGAASSARVVFGTAELHTGSLGFTAQARISDDALIETLILGLDV